MIIASLIAKIKFWSKTILTVLLTGAFTFLALYAWHQHKTIKQLESQLAQEQKKNEELKKSVNFTNEEYYLLLSQINYLQEQTTMFSTKYYQVKKQLDSLSEYNSRLKQYTFQLEQHLGNISQKLGQLSREFREINRPTIVNAKSAKGAGR